MNETGILDQFDKLCDLHLGPVKRAYRSQPKISREKTKTKLRKLLFDTLFHNLETKRLKEAKRNEHTLNEKQEILLEIYKLRLQRKFEDADKLENLFNQLKKENGNSDVWNYLKFIVTLKNTTESESQNQFGEDVFHFPVAEKSKVYEAVPYGALSYGDLKKTLVYSQHYMHFPRSVFQKEFSELINEKEMALCQALASTPGSYLCSEDWFTTKFVLNDDYERTTQNTLFGGLVQGRVADLEAKLELPDISSSPELRIPEFKCRIPHSKSTESGLGSETDSMSSSVVTLVSDGTSGYCDSVWEDALSETLSDHYSWEWRGYQPGPTERPYLTEAGIMVLDLLHLYRRNASSVLLGQRTADHLVAVDEDALRKSLHLMLIGVPSSVFPFDNDNKCFAIKDNLHISGTFPDMLTNVLTEFVDCGTFFIRLKEFSEPSVLDSINTPGLVFQAFCSAIRNVLQQFSAEVLTMSPDMTLMQLSDCLHRSMQQLRYLAQLCHCCDDPPGTDVRNSFPAGMKLLTYLYEETQMSASSPHYAMFLSILRMSCAPFVLFLRDWIFYGIHRDIYREFIINVEEDALIARDDRYWKQAYTILAPEDQNEAVPEFLRDILDDIITCGKSINLLRICHPQHFICNVSESIIPPLTVTFCPSYIRDIEVVCQAYSSRMKQMSRQITEDRQEMQKRQARQKLELLQMARVVAQKEINRLQGIIDQRRAERDAKKRVEFQRLKKQMEEDLLRRSNQVQEEKEEDQLYMAKISKQEDLRTEQEIELEKKARDELIAYYTELGEEAMHRERVALWRVRRAQLEHARFLFLEADAKKWQDEWLNHQDDVDGRLSPTPPRWAERAANREVPLVVSGVEEVALPSWAARALTSLSPSEDVPALTFDVMLPQWAQRGLDPLNTHILTVSGDDDEAEKMHCGDGDTNAFEKPFAGPDSQSEPLEEVLMSRTTDISSIIGEKSPKGFINFESISYEPKPHVQKVGDNHVSSESDAEPGSKLNIKMVEGRGALMETQETVVKRHIKTSAHMSATKESEITNSPDLKPHIKFTQGFQVNQETDQERAVAPRKKKNSDNVSLESRPQVWAIKKPSKFGHVSSQSSYTPSVPKLRRVHNMHPSVETSLKDFSIKSQVRTNKTRFASKESIDDGQQEYRPHIRILPNRNSNMESEQVDENALRKKKFLAQNFRGHSSDSTVQRLLYGDAGQLKTITEDSVDGVLEKIVFGERASFSSEAYQTEFSQFAQEPFLDLMGDIHVVDLGKALVGAVVSSQEEVEVEASTPLSVLLSCSLTTPVKAQISLVNSAIINYFTSDLKIDSHFEAIKRYLLMADGDFAEILANILFEKLATNPLPQNMINPCFLNGALTKAIRSSNHSDDLHTKNLSFYLKFVPPVLLPNDPGSLKCLKLQYAVNWPLTIVLTKDCMKKYYSIFHFLLQIKRVVWVLKDVYHQLKRDAIIHKAGNSSQFRKIQLHRQEMQHFVKMMQGYITNQVIHVSWQEFQSDLSQPIDGLDQLCAIHERYVNRALFRCLLDAKAVKVRKIILDIFCLILKFRSQLVSGQWQGGEGPDKEACHDNFDAMVNTYQSFHVYSLFLFKVVSRLSQKGYQPHLQELLLQLDFNGYYTQACQ